MIDGGRAHPCDAGAAGQGHSGEREMMDAGDPQQDGRGAHDRQHPSTYQWTSDERLGRTPQAVASKRANKAAQRHAKKLLSSTQP